LLALCPVFCVAVTEGWFEKCKEAFFVHSTLNFYRHTMHLDITKVFDSPTNVLLLILENSKIYIKTYIKIAPTCFGLQPLSGSLHLSLAKVTLMLKQSVKLRRRVLCGRMRLTLHGTQHTHHTWT
jgi:hypothetical protein